MRLYQRGRVWWCWGYDRTGKRWSESTHQRDKRAGEIAAREIERRFAAGADLVRHSRLTLEKALLILLEYQRTAGRSPATIRATTYHARHLVTVMDRNRRLDSITLADTTSYMAVRLEQPACKSGSKRTSRHTVLKEIKTLTQAMRRAAKLGEFVPTLDPTHFMPDELGGAYKPRSRWLTRTEYVQLLAALRPDRRDYVVAWCNLGMRKAELFDAQPEHYNAERRELFVDGTKTDEAARVVPANEDAHEVLTRRIAAAGALPPFPEWGKVTRDLEVACRRAGVAKVTPNDLRRTFCSWLCQAGVPERVAADLLGHTDTTMVRAVYGHLDRPTLAAAVARLSSPAPVAEGVAPTVPNQSASGHDRPSREPQNPGVYAEN